MLDLRPFQRTFMRAVENPAYDTIALSIPRGNGKSAIAGHVLTRCLTPGDSLHETGAEYLLCSGSIEQSRLVFRFIRPELEPTGEYRFIDSTTRLGITHKATNTKLRVLSSNGKTAMGIVGTPLLVADEPGAWEKSGGTLMHDAISTAQGKPGSPLRVIYIGTLAPSSSGWWHDLIEGGTRGATYVQSLQGDTEKWDSWHEIKRNNPLVMVDAGFRKKLLEERDDARADTRLKARFLSYRLNVPSADESQVLLTVDEWKRVCERDVPEREGRPIVGVDLGAGRAWSAAVAVYQNGRVEAVACAPGIPSIAEQEKRDRVSTGLYQRLVDDGQLIVAEGLRVQPPEQLVDMVVEKWGRPLYIICDRFRLSSLLDCVGNRISVQSRVTRWSEASEDIRALRKMALDGPLAIDHTSRSLVTASLAVAQVKSDDQGNTRLAKRGNNNEARDDVAAALVLAAGAHMRTPRPKRRRRRFRVVG